MLDPLTIAQYVVCLITTIPESSPKRFDDLSNSDAPRGSQMKTRRVLSILASVLGGLGIAIGWHSGMFVHPDAAALRPMRYEVTTASGAPLASIFGGGGPRLGEAAMRQLQARAGRPFPTSCPKGKAGWWTGLANVFGVRPVYAQGDCSSFCSSCWNTTVNAGDPSCPELTACAYSEYGEYWGCDGYLYNCGQNQGYQCGQHICPNPDCEDGN
jgi:hypothetical protein